MHLHSIHSENAKTRVGKSQRWGKPHKNRRDWKEYNEELVIRGKMIFDMDFRDQWELDLKNMNMGKRGSPCLFPESFMRFMMIWK